MAWPGRPDGGRSFGFTGGDRHWNWGNPNFRTIVLNGIAWTAKIDIPPGGVPSKNPTLEELEADQGRAAAAHVRRPENTADVDRWK